MEESMTSASTCRRCLEHPVCCYLLPCHHPLCGACLRVTCQPTALALDRTRWAHPGRVYSFEPYSPGWYPLLPRCPSCGVPLKPDQLLLRADWGFRRAPHYFPPPGHSHAYVSPLFHVSLLSADSPQVAPRVIWTLPPPPMCPGMAGRVVPRWRIVLGRVFGGGRH